MRKAIVEARKERKLTQEQAAEVFGVTRIHWVGVETGNRKLSPGLGIKIHTAWNIPIEDLQIG